MEELIRKVLLTLDMVEVKGRKNIDRLLGCMQALEKIADALAHNREALKEAQTKSNAPPVNNNPPSEEQIGSLTSM